MLTALLLLCATAMAVDDPLASCEEALQTDPTSGETASCVYRAARVGGGYEQAIARLEEVVVDHPGAPWPAMTLTNLHCDQGPRPEAVGELAAAASAFDAAGDTRGSVFARLNRSPQLLRIGREDEAIGALAEALTIAEAAGDEGLAVTAQVAQARLLWRLDRDLEEAYRLLEDLEPRLFPDGDYQSQLVWLKVRSELALRTGRFDEGLAALQRLEELVTSSGDSYALGQVLYDQLRLVHDLPGRTAALHQGDPVAYAARTAAAAAASDNAWAAAAAECVSAKLLGDSEAARTALRACIERADATDTELTIRIEARADLARLVYATDPLEAEALLQEADVLARGDDSWEVHIPALDARASLAFAAGFLDAGTAAGLEAIEILETASGAGVGNPSDLALNLWWLGQLYYTLADHLRAERPEEALQLMERYRAQVLLRRLLDQRTFRASDEERSQVARLEDALAEARDRLWEADSDDRIAILAEVDELKRRIARLKQAMRARDDRTGLLQTEAPTLEELQQALRPDEAIIAWQLPVEVGPKTSRPGAWAWVVTREGLTSVPMPQRDDLEEPLALFAGLFVRRDGSEAVPAVGLYRQLLAPALDALPEGIERLVLVPDGPLHTLPFGALRDTSDGPPLDARFVVSSVPSLTLWHRWRLEPDPVWRRGAVVLGDPAFDDPGDLGRLPAAAAEAQRVLEHVGNASLALDAAASEPWLEALVDDTVGIVHLAAHAVVDDVYPERSAILLAPAAGDDGRLDAHEIAALQLDSPLVVLSSCRGASGPVLGGEGPMALSRAFFQGGAQTVIASLWPLRDDDAAALFDTFYEGIARGEDAGSALASAKRARIEAGAPAEGWAGVVLLGESDHVPLPGGQPTMVTRTPVAVMAAGVLGLLSLLGLGWWWTRRR